MATLLPSLKTGLIPELGTAPDAGAGLENWLLSSTLVPTEIENGGPNLIRFEVGDIDSLVPYLSYDFSRFSLASVESLLRASEVPTGAANHAAWRLLELYYSAFFAGHALTRSQGAGVAVLSAPAVERLTELELLYEVDVSDLRTGSWFFQVQPGEGPKWHLTFRPVARGSGVHDSFWREFCAFLNRSAALAVANGLPDSTEFVASAAELADRIRFGGEGTGAWLARVRNDINYKQSHDAWYPQPKRSRASDALIAARIADSSSVRLDTSRDKDPLVAFAWTCSFLSSLSYELSSFVAGRSTRGGAFGQRWRRFQGLVGLPAAA